MSGKLKVHVGEKYDSMARRVAAAWHRAERGEKMKEEHVTFASWETLARIMTNKRFELLRHLHRHPAASVAELARALGRDYKRVHEDVASLSEAGLIDRTPRGLEATYSEIRTVIAI